MTVSVPVTFKVIKPNDK